MSDSTIIKILTEYIPRKKSINVEETHAIRNQYTCANPDGPVSNIGCPEDDPLCNCPAKELMPRKEYIASIYEDFEVTDETFLQTIKTEIQTTDNEFVILSGLSGGEKIDPPEIEGFFPKYEDAVKELRGITPEYNEPSDEDLEELLLNSKECAKIEEVLGEEWLGCDWEDPNGFLSCNCPEVGERFAEYLAYNNTLASFWTTPAYVPLYSVAQRALLSSQKIMISVAGNLSIRPGHVISLEIDSENLESESDNPDPEHVLSVNRKNAKFTGRWLVQSINHKIAGVKLHKMELICIRDTLPRLDDLEEE